MRVGERFYGRLWAVLLLLANGLAGTAKAETIPLTLLYYERPPFHYTGIDHKPAGILVDATERALRAAGLSFIWQIRAPKRILNEVFDGRANTCSPGWFTTAERREKAVLSEPMMTEPPLVGVVNEQSRKKASDNARATIPAMDIILVRDYLSRGGYLDELLANLPAGRVVPRTNTDIPSMLATVAAHRADMALMTEEEAAWFLPKAAPGLSMLHFTDNDRREGRYLICSKQTDPALIVRFNAALRAP